MEATQQTLQQIERAITKVAGKYSQVVRFWYITTMMWNFIVV